jgi:hypothetical protein
MFECTRCTIAKDASAFRHKTSGPRAGYRFPVCIQCEGEQSVAALAVVVRGAGYTATANDPAVRQREEADVDDGARIR